MTIVTRDSLAQLLTREDIRVHVLGRALKVLMDRQTEDERSSNTTNHSNNRGFASCDAKQGTITAKTYIKRGTLLDFQVEFWTKPMKNGYPRICKYHAQLNEAAEQKKA